MGKEKKEKKEKTPSKNKENDDDEGGELQTRLRHREALADIGFHRKSSRLSRKVREKPNRRPRSQGIGRPRSPDVLHTDVQSIHPSNVA